MKCSSHQNVPIFLSQYLSEEKLGEVSFRVVEFTEM